MGNAYSFICNGRDELTNISYPAGVSQSLGNDAAGRVMTDHFTQPNRAGFPYEPGTVLRSFSVGSRSARGQLPVQCHRTGLLHVGLGKRRMCDGSPALAVGLSFSRCRSTAGLAAQPPGGASWGA